MPHTVDVYVGQRVRQRRWMMGLTQEQLANQVGIKFQQVQKYETGVNRVSASRMWDIANALDVPVSFFFAGLEGQAAHTRGAQGDVLTDKEASDLVRAYFAIPDSLRKRLLDLARVLAGVRPAPPTGPRVNAA